MRFVESQKIKNSFAFNVDIFADCEPACIVLRECKISSKINISIMILWKVPNNVRIKWFLELVGLENYKQRGGRRGFLPCFKRISLLD